MTEYLLTQELHTLTGYARPTSQTAWLKERGIPHRLDGRRIIVSRVHVQAWIEGRPTVTFGWLNLQAAYDLRVAQKSSAKLIFKEVAPLVTAVAA